MRIAESDVNTYATEQEQIEAVKKWWKENGLAIVIGLTLGLGGLFGWRYWERQQVVKAAQASLGYQQVLSTTIDKKYSEAQVVGDKLLKEYPDSVYAELGALVLARAGVESGRMEDAKARLNWLLDHGTRSEVRQFGRERLARILLAENKPDEAWSVLEKSESKSDSAALAELRGDVRSAQGRRDEARTLYAEALRLQPVAAETDVTPLQLKLDDLGETPVATSK